MSYDHRGLVDGIGGLGVRYNPTGKLIHAYGTVNPYNDWCPTCNVHGCTMKHDYDRFRNNNDHDYGYYSKDANRKRKRYD